MEYAATITKAIQTGTDAFRDKSITKIFKETATIRMVTEWAESEGSKFHECLISEVVK